MSGSVGAAAAAEEAEGESKGVVGGSVAGESAGIAVRSAGTAGGAAGDAGASRRRRPHRRVVFRGTERFDADGLFGDDGVADSTDPEVLDERLRKSADDDSRILNELPPHWAKFDAEGRR
ncbi:hypothetical protein Uis1B_0116 [Bifidobacterium margollesii]|uniref:Uncharacterized protein n=1 Tax=Bifidobacterium margollesii TaxID=2020964 RepID=A0A2N5JCT2_9BIFI|nr:hypothetical protein [Bifidobacterium margollesii]PLS32024.1 hypothetical protein Uis1B_0116 [Bifidobacterium margollesii]